MPSSCTQDDVFLRQPSLFSVYDWWYVHMFLTPMSRLTESDLIIVTSKETGKPTPADRPFNTLDTRETVMADLLHGGMYIYFFFPCII
jgi:hypothetical protein